MNAILNIQCDDRAVYDMLSQAKGAVAARETINKVSAAAVAVLMRSHFLTRNARSSRSNYWAKAAEATTHGADASSGWVTTRHPGIAWHRWGGTINAKPGKALAIPLRDDVHGIRPSEKWPDRESAFVYRRRGKAFLAARENGVLCIFYLLVKSVTKGPNADVMPSDANLKVAAYQAVRALLQNHLSRRFRAP